jgi:ketosteroid isomerase-like protein
VSERDEFLAWIDSEWRAAEVALHNGDPAPRAAIWSKREPVTVFGAWQNAVGQQEVGELFRILGERFTDSPESSFELVAGEAVGDLAYTVGFEHTQATVDGAPRTYTLRVTQVYRREDGDWKVVHRHGDELPPDKEL